MKYEKEHIEFIKENYSQKTARELANMFNEYFHANINRNSIKSLMYRNGIKFNHNNKGEFKKGNIPYNKGKKMSKEQYEKCKATMFKKGNIPKNYKQVGSERITKDGYTEIKTEYPNVWKLKHRVIYEQHYGKLNKNEVVIFADGNRENFEIDNLIKVTRAQLKTINEKKLYLHDKELTKTGVNIAKLIEVIRKRSKNKSGV
ncbi:hypothetical protein HMPREF9628_00161 [Peptoanaerobacter stomatis]|uniref:HNH nuclease domain-containing protein n=1 Tax=Peptoanaerobacter stomatis TaxID=796937 RepID=G9XBV3_9FIRM|nr:HNH endonuclease signature motif containing protein [Peptoanaerobacter stomatis]EHL19440.1 hypothetical protein HMPREF9628_00161 [Peptoanaerobacter stomatis]